MRYSFERALTQFMSIIDILLIPFKYPLIHQERSKATFLQWARAIITTLGLILVKFLLSQIQKNPTRSVAIRWHKIRNASAPFCMCVALPWDWQCTEYRYGNSYATRNYKTSHRQFYFTVQKSPLRALQTSQFTSYSSLTWSQSFSSFFFFVDNNVFL